jgi:MFS family permease
VRAQLRLLWLASFAFFASFFLLLGALPLYPRNAGISDRSIGAVLGSFALVSMVVRPWAGWASDRYGRRPLMLAGAAVFTLAPAAYVSTVGLGGILAVRLLHGAGMGLYPTAASAVVADLAPPERRGAVMGNFAVAANLAMALAPLAGLAVVDRVGFAPLFWLAAGVALVGLALTRRMPETVPGRARIPFAPGSLLSAAALFPASLVFLLMVGYGALVTFLPIHAREQEVNAGLFFLVFALVTTVVRGAAGRVTDRFGRVPVAFVGLLLARAGLAVVALARGAPSLIGAGALFGLGAATASTALMTWTADVVDVASRGRAMGTYYTALELGIGLGALLAGVGVEALGFAPTFLAFAAAAPILPSPGSGRGGSAPSRRLQDVHATSPCRSRAIGAVSTGGPPVTGML